MAEFSVQDEILALQLPEMLKKIGEAVDHANRGVTDFHICEAEAELRIAIHVRKDTQTELGAGGRLYGIGINASYQNQYGYSAEGASLIKLKFKAGPRPNAGQGPAEDTEGNG